MRQSANGADTLLGDLTRNSVNSYGFGGFDLTVGLFDSFGW